MTMPDRIRDSVQAAVDQPVDADQLLRRVRSGPERSSRTAPLAAAAACVLLAGGVGIALQGQSGSDTATVASADGEPSQTPTATPSASSRDRWRSAGSDDYSFTLQLQCFCPTLGDHRVTVVDDELARIEAPRGGESPALERFKVTIDDLFDLIEQPNGDASVRAEYDSEYGYPTKIEVDPEPNTIDDEYTYLVSDYTPT